MKKKKCSGCGKKRVLTKFYKNKSSYSGDGLQNNCIDCQRKYAKNYYDNNSKLVIEKSKKRYRASKENK